MKPSNISNADWEKYCRRIQGIISDLCDHKISKDEAYEEIMEETNALCLREN